MPGIRSRGFHNAAAVAVINLALCIRGFQYRAALVAVDARYDVLPCTARHLDSS